MVNNNMFFQIKGKKIGKNTPCFIIAEAGSNHDRNFNKAIKLIEVAASAGTDAVKFQLFSADKIAAKTKNKIASLKDDKFGKYGTTLHDFYNKLELPLEWLPKLKKYADRCKIIFSATPFDEDAVDILEKIGVYFYKIASFEIVHLPLIKYAANKKKPIIISTGMANIEEIDDAIRTIKTTGNKQYALLHCGVEYPLRMEDVNLAAMETIYNKFLCPIGYSDHTLGITVPIAAVARGAKIIEKHFTLDRKLSGPDHKFALSPRELKSMVIAIHDAEMAIGTPEKKAVKNELIHLKRGRRSLYANQVIEKGERISEKMLSILRPNIGLKPKYIYEIVGKRAKKHIKANESITWDKINSENE